MTTHTSGPWIVVDNGDDTEYGAFTIASCSEEACFAPIADFKLAESGYMEPDGNGGSQEFAHYSVGRDECLANARLCAAAPELLTACQKLIDCLVESHQDELTNDHFGDNPAGCTYCQAILEGGAAINKALKGDDQ